jgi:2-polyprenyl-3-methyl-5-hydroxy-6-metoxy-1,4-benzoquinol methylase
MKSRDLVRDHFDRAARRFDAVYETDKPAYQRAIDRLFRRVVVERFQLIVTLAPTTGRWSVLDVGCGSGRYALALADEGASRVVGVDFADEMIRLARDAAEQKDLSSVCEFHVSEYVAFESDEVFDVVVATGYFDYLERPELDLAKMVGACSGRIYASFPKRWEWRVPLRVIRFFLSRAFVRFYSKREVLALFEDAGVPPERLSLVDLGRDWIAVARP